MNCPVCGSPNIHGSTQRESMSDSFGGFVEFDKRNYVCEDCGSEGDLFNENESAVVEALTFLEQKLVSSVLSSFSDNSVSFAAIERALDLPQRTLTKWKNGSSSPSSTGVALLKYLKVFPWLLEVADNKFDYEASQRIYMGHALKTFLEKMSFDERDVKNAGVITTANSAFVYFQTQRNFETLQDVTPSAPLVVQGSLV